MGVSVRAFMLNGTEEMVKIVVLSVIWMLSICVLGIHPVVLGFVSMPRMGLVDVVVILAALLPPGVVTVEASELSVTTVTTVVSVAVVLDVVVAVIGVVEVTVLDVFVVVAGVVVIGMVEVTVEVPHILVQALVPEWNA